MWHREAARVHGQHGVGCLDHEQTILKAISIDQNRHNAHIIVLSLNSHMNEVNLQYIIIKPSLIVLPQTV